MTPYYEHAGKKAGFRRVGRTKAGLIAWQMVPEDMPEAEEPQPFLGELFREHSLLNILPD